jgi:hypothetical protein
VTSDRSRTSLETEYPHLSVVHLFKEPLHQQRRGAHYTELKNPVKLREKIYFNHSPNLMPEQHYRTGKPATSSPPRPTHPVRCSKRGRIIKNYQKASRGLMDYIFRAPATGSVTLIDNPPALQAIDHLRPSDAKQAGGSGHIAVGTRKRTLQ